MTDTTEQATLADPTTAEVFETVSTMLKDILAEAEVDDVEITMDSGITEDLELESIDLVTLASRLAERYGEQVNLAEFLAEMELDEIISLTVGSLVRYVVSSL